MDTITHGLLGAVLTQSLAPRPIRHRMAALGAIAAMAPDLDLIIQSSKNPLLTVEYHRHFTHALAFIPLGALMVALVLYRWWRKSLNFKQAYLVSLLGYSTHSLLDSATSYGTTLLWPFSLKRIAWDYIPIVEPLFTLLLILGCWLSARKTGARTAARVFLALAMLVLSFGVYQHHQGMELQAKLALSRGQTLKRGRMMPTLGNLLIWRSVYEAQENIYIDGLRMIPGKAPEYHAGGQVRKISSQEVRDRSLMNELGLKQLSIFYRFADDYVGELPTPSLEIGDMRYGFSAYDMEPLWGLKPKTDGSFEWRKKPESRAKRYDLFWEMFEEMPEWIEFK